MNNDTLIYIAIPAVILTCLACVFFLWKADKIKRMQLRVARVTGRKTSGLIKTGDPLTLRRRGQESNLPLIGKLLQALPTQAALHARLERAGLNIPADIYALTSGSVAILIAMLTLFLGKPPVLGVLAGFLLAVALPYKVVGIMGDMRIKRFLSLFPEAIDFIVRGLRSGLPITESIGTVSEEMKEPVSNVFSSIKESMRLGVPLEKALQDVARKLASTEFNFFVTSIVLQRETGGNLSEILGNLSDVLRKRFMMRMKIKAMSSEAKASAMIVGSLPFFVILALSFITPRYLDPLLYDPRGHFISLCGVLSFSLGIGIMFKMTRFEI